MAKGWFNLDGPSPSGLEAAANVIPDNQFFEHDHAFKSCGIKLSKTTRLYGFVGCTVIGFVISILGVIMLLVGSIISFALLYGLGTIISLMGTAFIVGPMQQVQNMFKPTRMIASAVLLLSIALIFVGAFVLDSGALCIIFVIIQFIAYTWYTLSYIPYARSAVRGVFSSII